MKCRLILLIVFLSATIVGKTQAPPSASRILKEASELAAKEKKNVFVIFHASWCGWCHKMDTSMNDKTVKKFFDDNFVIRHLVVHESKGKEGLENPGALELLKEYKGDDSGIPFWLIFDKDGKLLADSKLRTAANEAGDNTGCPANEKEVAYFVEVLKQTTSLTDENLSVIAKLFRKNESN